MSGRLQPLWADRNPRWKGDAANYTSLHRRIYRRRGQPSQCTRCGTTDPNRRYEWANLTGRYEDVNDYERMCKSCHQKFDEARRPTPEIDHGTNAGWMTHFRRHEQPCEPCRLARNAYARERYRRRKEQRSGEVQ